MRVLTSEGSWYGSYASILWKIDNEDQWRIVKFKQSQDSWEKLDAHRVVSSAMTEHTQDSNLSQLPFIIYPW